MKEADLKRKILIDNDVVSLYYYPDKKIIHHTFKKFVFGTDFQKVMETGAEYFEKEGCRKWLSDDRNSSVLRKVDLEWGEEHWRARILKAGWKYWAIMMPDLTVGKMTMKHIINDYKSSGVNVEIFDNLDLALKWLDDQK